jgi:hypothetical protein
MDRARLPALPLADWEPSRLYLQLVSQIVGKTRLKLHPPINHWWHVSLYLSARGLTTAGIPYREEQLDIEIDLIDHKVVVRLGDQTGEVALYGQPICDFYADYRSVLKDLDVDVHLLAKPYRCKSTVPFPDDSEHCAYDTEAVHRAWQVLAQVDKVMKEFRSRFIGKCSPVHQFWHSFDLACTRFSGRAAPPIEADRVTQEAYSHEVISTGFWFGDDNTPEASFYAYSAPAPKGLADQPLSPAQARWVTLNGAPMALLAYEDVRKSADPEAMVLEFQQSAYEAGARLAGWDRAALERPGSS